MYIYIYIYTHTCTYIYIYIYAYIYIYIYFYFKKVWLDPELQSYEAPYVATCDNTDRAHCVTCHILRHPLWRLYEISNGMLHEAINGAIDALITTVSQHHTHCSKLHDMLLYAYSPLRERLRMLLSVAPWLRARFPTSPLGVWFRSWAVVLYNVIQHYSMW